VSAVLFMLVGGLAYPLLTTLVANLLFPYQAQGSLIERNGQIIGSELIGQQFTSPQYFHPRPSATLTTDGTKPDPYNAAFSLGSNLGPTNKALISEVRNRAEAYRKENGLPANAKVPVDAVTASSSGLDPHITPANAELQIPRVAEERSIRESEVRRLVEENTEGRQLGFLGEQRVNVLELNLALDEAARR
jgi:potassium-transporting ATPase KdpC subunit